MNEALNSVTYDLTTGNGFKVLFTMRDESTDTLLAKMAKMEAVFLANGATPTIKKTFGGGFAKKEVKSDGKICPKCGGDLVIKTSKDGKQFYSCSNSKYDFETKTKSGCDFFEWVQQDTNELASEKQIALIKAKWGSEYKEDMTKAEANKIITAHMGN